MSCSDRPDTVNSSLALASAQQHLVLLPKTAERKLLKRQLRTALLRMGVKW